MTLDEICVHQKAHKQNPEDLKYLQWGCNNCDGYNKDCDNYVSLSEVMFPEEPI